MWAKLRSKNAITGFGALCLSIASFTAQIMLAPEGLRIVWLSPLGISTIALLILGIYFIFLGIFKHELSFSEKENIVRQRQEFIPQFRQIIDRMMTRMKEVATEAGRLPYQQYVDEYVTPRGIYHGILGKNVVVTTVRLYKTGLSYNNPFFHALEDRDTVMISLKKEYATYLARISDKFLTNELESLFKHAEAHYSFYTLLEMTQSKDLPLSEVINSIHLEIKHPIAKILYSARRGSAREIESKVNHLHKSVNDRFDELLGGDDL